MIYDVADGATVNKTISESEERPWLKL